MAGRRRLFTTFSKVINQWLMLPTSDVDYRVIGLSPQYWANTPLLVGDVLGLLLINGIDCLVVSPYDADNADNVADDDDNDDHHVPPKRTKLNHKDDDVNSSWNILPVSRVLLRGIATTVDRRPHGCTLIVLDDGTGFIDCRLWDNSDTDNTSAYNLPALLPEHEPSNNDNNKRRREQHHRFAVGDSIEVMGKIKVMTAGTIVNNNDDNHRCNNSDTIIPPLEVRYGCIREIHATSICVINDRPTKMSNQWNGEIVHWLKCMKFIKQCSTSKLDDGKRQTIVIRNGKNILPLLGETIVSSILNGTCGNCSSGGSSNFDKRNVLDRQCCQTSHRFRNAFYYCHCEATLEVLDPIFRFRNALLNRLLDMESQLQSVSDSYYPSSTEDCMDLLGVSSVTDDTIIRPPLLFDFKTIFKDTELLQIASEIVSLTNVPEVNTHRLMRKVFISLTNDGILSLFDIDEDIYVLITRERVIEPYLRRTMGMDNFGIGDNYTLPPPFFIRNIPKKRIEAIKTSIQAAT
jgi:hypothetical protein